MTEKFETETSTTPGESPFSNGKVERGNAMLYETMMKTMEDVNCNMEIALVWAVSTKNTLQNISGYSPNHPISWYLGLTSFYPLLIVMLLQL